MGNEMKHNDVTVKPFEPKDMPRLWSIAYSQDKPKWADYNAPYFREYKKVELEYFLDKASSHYINVPKRLAIFYKDKLVGSISYFWEDEATRWMEYGLAIYDDEVWGNNIGYDASVLVIDKVFEEYPEIERIGCTTWSGNPGMMRLAEKLGMQLEGRMRKTRFWENVYYDSLKYGVLRSEWNDLKLTEK